MNRTAHLRDASRKWREMAEAEKDPFYRIWHREMVEFQRKYDDWVAEEKEARDRPKPWRYKLNVDVEVYTARMRYVRYHTVHLSKYSVCCIIYGVRIVMKLG